MVVICPVLRLQRGPGVPAHYVHQLQRRKGPPDQIHPPPRPLDHGLFRRFLDRPQPGLPQPLHPHFYEPHGRDPGNGPAIVRAYGLSFLLLPFNIFSTYYFQAILKSKAAFFISVARGLVINGALILLLPALTGPDSLWFAMPVTELLVMFCAAAAIRRYTRALPESP